MSNYFNENLLSTSFMQIKRKFEQFQEDSDYVVTFRLASKEFDSTPNVKKICEEISFCSIDSVDNTDGFSHEVISNSKCSSSSLTFEDRYDQEPVYIDVTMLDGAMQHGLYSKDFSPLVESDESFTSLNQSSFENLNESPMENFDDSVHSSDVSSADEPESLIVQALRLWISKADNIPKEIPMEDVNGSPHLLDLAILKDQDLRLRKALKLLISNNDHLPRPVIPIGTGFQAEIPEWTGSINRDEVHGSDGDSGDSRWLGTRIWPPIEGASKGRIVTKVGKQRLDSCSCISQKSISCMKRHILEASLQLQSELGMAFWSWKFDEMGEVVSKSWTTKEQQSFKSLVKRNPLTSGTNFWELALKRFPSKSLKSLVSYYYNVFIPWRMSHKTRYSHDEIDSDEDHEQNSLS